MRLSPYGLRAEEDRRILADVAHQLPCGVQKGGEHGNKQVESQELRLEQ